MRRNKRQTEHAQQLIARGGEIKMSTYLILLSEGRIGELKPWVRLFEARPLPYIKLK